MSCHTHVPSYVGMCCHTHVRLTVQQMLQLTVAHSAEGPFKQSEPGAALVGKHLLTSEAAEISPLFHSPFFFPPFY